MNFIFNYGKKMFLTGKRSARVDLKTEKVVERISREPNRDYSESLR